MALGRVCVFCGSKVGVRPTYRAVAETVGRELAQRGVGVVYGGGDIGLMGVVADAALAAGGEVVGVIPEFMLDHEVGHRGVTSLEVVGSMHERKARMADLADAFVALPGGLGTLEELFEIWTWAQLRLHTKPVGLLDVDGYFTPLVEFVQRTVDEGFVSERTRDLLHVGADVVALLDDLEATADRAPSDPGSKWADGDGLART